MKYVVFPLVALAGLLSASVVARADWNVGDLYKMHYPQLPDPTGWDVNFTHGGVVADDWLCTQSGPVTDIHFWFSARGDQPFDIGQIPNIRVTIHDDIPANQNPLGYSMPGNVLWQRDVPLGEFTIRPYGQGQQGWIAPPEIVIPADHQRFWQANITNIPDPFPQEAGNTYWLELNVTALDVFLGWKTSASPHFQDDAVWGLPGMEPYWHPLADPRGSLDMAFVITVPEASTLALLATGAIGLAPYLWRRRPPRPCRNAPANGPGPAARA